MTPSAEERAQRARLEEAYGKSQSPVMLRIERSVCGCDYGGNSWTTEPEARQIAERLGLGPGRRLLDLGAGSGWPGLYLRKLSGCDLTLVDLPITGIRIAVERGERDVTSGAVHSVVADAANLPFPDDSFDAINQSDLLCCLLAKRSVLEACRRAIRTDGRMSLSVISISPGLSAEQYRRAVANGPEFIESKRDYPTLLSETGWSIAERQDITAAYSESCRRQLDADLAHEADLAALIGSKAVEERCAEWRAKLAALAEGLLRREVFLAMPC